MGFDKGKPVNRPAFWFDWDEPTVERLKELAGKGLTASAIADELGCPSRGAVIGKLDRLKRAGFQVALKTRAGFQPGPRGNTGGGTQRAIAARLDRETRKPIPPKRKDKPVPTPAPTHSPARERIEPPPGPVNILDLKDWSCRWIVNDDLAKALYCGRPRDPDSYACYCDAHRRMAFVRSPAPPRRYNSFR